MGALIGGSYMRLVRITAGENAIRGVFGCSNFKSELFGYIIYI